MSSGHIYIAQDSGVYVVKLIGDVRLNLSGAFDCFQRKVEESGVDPSAVFIDLTEAIGLDSTTLGLLAKISLMTQKRYQWIPTIVSPNEDINRILYSMGFDQLFSLVKDPVEIPSLQDMEEAETEDESEAELKERIIQAHRVLMSLNEENKHKFKDLVEMLSAEN